MRGAWESVKVTLAVVLLVSAHGEAAFAAPACATSQLEARLAAIDASGRPDAKGVPTEIHLGLTLIDLLSVDEAQQRFTADLRVVLSWRDPRLAAEALGCEPTDTRLPLASVWHPEMVLINGIEVDRLNQVLAIGAGGRLSLVERHTGAFSSPMALQDFPLDTQQLNVLVGTVLLGPDQVRVRIDPEQTGVFGATTVAGWSVDRPSYEVGTAGIAETTIHRVRYAFPARRSPGYFIYKVVLPIALIVAMSWSVFWIDPRYVNPQLGVAASSVLTVIAFQLSFGDLLPQIPYLTRLDRFVLGSTVLVFAALGEGIWTSSLSARDRLPAARRLDRLSRVAFPLGYGAFAIWCFA